MAGPPPIDFFADAVVVKEWHEPVYGSFWGWLTRRPIRYETWQLLCDYCLWIRRRKP